MVFEVTIGNFENTHQTSHSLLMLFIAMIIFTTRGWVYPPKMLSNLDTEVGTSSLHVMESKCAETLANKWTTKLILLERLREL